mmetsp:Transcript_15259/g.51489  ORF Transcript_15259/g.51489 Transcript_15259/m.51489 type:complete len:208 (-) Transcript_15259:65-688(-)
MDTGRPAESATSGRPRRFILQRPSWTRSGSHSRSCAGAAQGLQEALAAHASAPRPDRPRARACGRRPKTSSARARSTQVPDVKEERACQVHMCDSWSSLGAWLSVSRRSVTLWLEKGHARSAIRMARSALPVWPARCLTFCSQSMSCMRADSNSSFSIWRADQQSSVGTGLEPASAWLMKNQAVATATNESRPMAHVARPTSRGSSS